VEDINFSRAKLHPSKEIMEEALLKIQAAL